MLYIQNHHLAASLLPEVGGGMASFMAFGREVFRSLPAGYATPPDPLRLACFPMTPYANRIANGRFRWLGEEISISPLWLPHALHGFGWRRPWRVDDHAATTATLAYEVDSGSWPWRYRCTQAIWLEEDALIVELAVQNLDVAPMPASLGLHPYFLGIEEASLTARTDGMWMTDADLIPTRWVALNDCPVSFHTARRIGGTDLDNCFTGFGGAARISWPERGMEVDIDAPGCTFLQVYTRGVDGSFCVEAQTAMPDAVNHRPNEDGRPTGIMIVAPGERAVCLTRFEVRLI